METTAFYRAYKDVLEKDELWRLINFGTRDNARHPMPWNGGTCGGFNEGAKTWLPLYPKYEEINAEADRATGFALLFFAGATSLLAVVIRILLGTKA